MPRDPTRARCRLEAEFNTTYRNFPDCHNPLDLLERIGRLQSEVRAPAAPAARRMGALAESPRAAQLPLLRADCETISAKKKELLESTQSAMVANREAIA